MADEKQAFGPLELPSGKKISFRAPTGGDRVNVIQMMNMSMDSMATGALLIDGQVAAKCVTEINGQTVDQTNYKRLFEQWNDEDTQWYQMVFQEMFGMTEDKRKSAKEAASFLRKGPICIGSSSLVDTVGQ